MGMIMFHSRKSGSLEAKDMKEDTWDLVLDDLNQKIKVVHSWSYMDGFHPWPATDGDQEFGVAEFMENGPSSAVDALRAIFKESPE